MPNVDTSSQFFTDYGNFAYAEGFFGPDPDAESVGTVLDRYSKNTREHTLQHYELFTNSFNKKRLTSHNLLYYHVYGDYRLVMEEGRPRYRYVAPDFTSSDVFEQPVLRKSETEYFLDDYLDNQKVGDISGIYNDVSNDGQLLFQFGEVPWLNGEIDREGTGTKFNLPSIGTQITKLHSFGNASDQIRDAMIGEMLELVSFYERNYDRIPDYVKIDTNDELIDLVGLRPADALNEDISDLFAILLTQLRNNPEYEEISELRVTKLDDDKVNRMIRELYTLDMDHDNESAVSRFVNVLFGAATQKFERGDVVQLTFNENDNRLQLIANQIEGGISEDPSQYQYDEFRIHTYNSGAPNNRDNGYTLIHIPTEDADNAEVEPINIEDNNADGGEYMFKDGDLRAVAELDFQASGDVQHTGGQIGKGKKKKKSKGKKTIEPALVVYQRVMLDTFAAFQALIYLSKWAGNNEMDRSIGRAKAENKMRFLSRGINVYSVQNQTEKSGGKKKSQVKQKDVFHNFPNMTHFALSRMEGISPKKDSKVGNFGLLDEMVKWRNYYNLSTLAVIRKKSFDKQLLDNFHSSNMLVAEIKWLTSALADGSRVLMKKKQPQDLLAQAQYKDLGNTGNITQFAPAPLETVFYEVDVPLLKMVIAEYNDVYNKTVIARAFNVPSTIESTQDSKKNVYDVLKEAKDLRTRAKNARDRGNMETYRTLSNEKGAAVGRAILLQPSAFIVDEPDPRQRDGRPSDFIGVTYKPTGDQFEFHVGPENIPSDLQGADNIRDDLQDRLADPISTMPEVQRRRDTSEGLDVPIITKKATKAPDEGQLAKLVWTSARDRIRGIFDIEGVKPHEFMDSLFNKIEDDLSRSNIMRSPFPEAWLGTDTVVRLRTDPMFLGMTVDRKYYTERLVEYVDALKSKYINNWRIPTTLVTMFENAIIKYTKDPDVLKKGFLERLEKDADRANLVTTNYVLRPYQITIAIMRNVLQVPLEDREMYTAEEIDNEMRRDIQAHLAGGEIKPILPQSHPLYSQFRPERSEAEEEPRLGEIQVRHVAELGEEE